MSTSVVNVSDNFTPFDELCKTGFQKGWCGACHYKNFGNTDNCHSPDGVGICKDCEHEIRQTNEHKIHFKRTCETVWTCGCRGNGEEKLVFTCKSHSDKKVESNNSKVVVQCGNGERVLLDPAIVKLLQTHMN